MVNRLIILLLLLCVTACTPSTASTRLMGELTIAQSRNDLVTKWRLEGDSHGWMLQPMTRYAESLGIIVVPVNSLKVDNVAASGGYNRKAKILWVVTEESPNMQVASFAHELGHALSPTKLRPHTASAEVYAEAVACLVMDAFGLDIRQASFAYISFTQEEGIPALQLYGVAIDESVAEIVAGIKRHQK